MAPPTPSKSDTGTENKEKRSDGPYYAWSNFPTEYDEHGVLTDSIEVGEEITQDDLGVSDEEWDYLIETGAISEDEYPDIPAHISPAEYEQHADTHAAMMSVANDYGEELATPAPLVDTNAGGDKFVDVADAPPKETPTPAAATKKAGDA